MNSSLLKTRLDRFRGANANDAIFGIQHGIERECLRINEQGELSNTPHPTALGSALKNSYITTDYSESLLELITTPICSIEETLARLHDIHKFTQTELADEWLWPNSMPCKIAHEDDIAIAHYGTSNLGRMKTLYREGLKHRYGSMMQVIAGLHYNFSLPQQFWALRNQSETVCQNTISQGYFDLIRNYQRMSWLIPYLFGASPAMSRSFLQNTDTQFPFETIGEETLYLPDATSLRMSDLGYTNDAQSSLQICYNTVDDYISTVRKAIETPEPSYQQYESTQGQRRKQLNANILQIENELYSSIRPKQPALPLEKPTDALAMRGVSYIEVRALDLQPDSGIGINAQQCYFLDAFLVYCGLSDSPFYSSEEYAEVDQNMTTVVESGRKPELQLKRLGQNVPMNTWGMEILEGVAEVADMMDRVHDCQRYSQAVASQVAKLKDVSLTPSAQILTALKQGDLDLVEYSLRQAKQHKTAITDKAYNFYNQSDFRQENVLSHAAQRELEDSDAVTFERFLQNYFDAEQSPKER